MAMAQILDEKEQPLYDDPEGGQPDSGMAPVGASDDLMRPAVVQNHVDHDQKRVQSQMVALDPNSPTYLKDLGALNSKSADLSQLSKLMEIHSAPPSYGGPGKHPLAGDAIPDKQLPQDELKFKLQNYDQQIQSAEDAGDHVRAGNLKLAKADYQQANPYGSEANHPGLMGKVGHILGRVGNIAGDIVAPATMSLIPGTDLNKGLQRQSAMGEIQLGEDTKLKDAQASNLAAKQEAPTGTPEQQLIKAQEELRKAPNDQARKVAQDKIDSIKESLTGAEAAKSAGKPVDENKAAIKDEGVTQHQQQLKTLEAGMKPEEAAAFEKAYGVKSSDQQNVATKRFEDAKASAAMSGAERDRALQRGIAERNHQDAVLAHQDTAAQGKTREVNTEIDKAQNSLKTDIDKSDAKINNLQEAVNLLDKPNGVKDALAPVKLLVAGAGGQGSGVRVTQAELNNIATARGWTDSAAVKLNNFFEPGSYEKMDSRQRDQMRGIIEDIYALAIQKNDDLHAAYNDITNAHNVDDVRKAQTKFNNAISGKNQAGTTGTKAKFDPSKLPSF